MGAEPGAPVPARRRVKPDRRTRLIQARRAGGPRLVFRGAIAGALAWWTSVIGNVSGIEFREIVVGVATGIAGLSALEAGSSWIKALSTPLPPPGPDWQDLAAGPAEELPPAESAARAPMERLAGRERALRELLALLGPATGGASREVAAAAATAGDTLREYGARLRAVEIAREGMDADIAASLDPAVDTLRQRLNEGVARYDRLVAAAADAVAADTAGGPDGAAMRRLSDAADALTGLARGLREIGPAPELPG
jgi:hypothetical protein